MVEKKTSESTRFSLPVKENTLTSEFAENFSSKSGPYHHPSPPNAIVVLKVLHISATDVARTSEVIETYTEMSALLYPSPHKRQEVFLNLNGYQHRTEIAFVSNAVTSSF